MADILPFPVGRTRFAAHRTDAPQLFAEGLPTRSDIDELLANTTANGHLETATRSAAASLHSVAVLTNKAEVLVARLAPDTGTDAGLCLAEANLSQYVLRDRQSFFLDAIFADESNDLWIAVSTATNFVKETGAVSCAEDGLEHYQV